MAPVTPTRLRPAEGMREPAPRWRRITTAAAFLLVPVTGWVVYAVSTFTFGVVSRYYYEDARLATLIVAGTALLLAVVVLVCDRPSIGYWALAVLGVGIVFLIGLSAGLSAADAPVTEFDYSGDVWVGLIAAVLSPTSWPLLFLADTAPFRRARRTAGPPAA